MHDLKEVEILKYGTHNSDMYPERQMVSVL